MKIYNMINEELQSLLTEKLIQVDNDVNLLYNKFFKNDIDKFQQTGRITNDMFNPDFTDTSILTDDISKQAHEKNPCEIKINNYHSSAINFYKPSENLISISANISVINLIKEHGNINITLENLPEEQRANFSNELTEQKLKGTIHHELTHWIDDTLHGNQITRHLDRMKTDKKYNIKYNEFPSLVNTTDFEMNSQIHNIKQAYEKYKNEWNDMTFDDLKSVVPTINVTFNRLPDEHRNYWLKKLKKRMHREGLLGKKMYN